MPDTGIDEAYEKMQKLRQDIKEKPAKMGNLQFPVTFTAGIAENDGDFVNAETEFDIKLPKSDSAMYFGKTQGRDLVVKYIENDGSKYYFWQGKDGNNCTQTINS